MNTNLVHNRETNCKVKCLLFNDRCVTFDEVIKVLYVKSMRPFIGILNYRNIIKINEKSELVGCAFKLE